MAVPITLSRRFLCLAAMALALLPPLWGQGNKPSPYAPQKVRAVVIGISEYSDEGISDLEYAHRDAQLFVELLRGQSLGSLAEEDLVLLLDGQATRSAILDALDNLMRQTGPNERAVIFFSGHGEIDREISRTGYLLCHDAVGERLFSSAVKFGQVQEVIATITRNKGTALLFVDACRSGELRESARNEGTAMTREEADREIKLLSTSSWDESNELASLGGGHGAFSYFLVGGLYGMADRDGDRWVELRELANYIDQEVEQQLQGRYTQPVQFFGNDGHRLARVRKEALARWRDRRREEGITYAVPRSRSTAVEVVLEGMDSTLQRNYREFRRTLSEKRLLLPTDDCADLHFGRLMAAELPETAKRHIQSQYLVALQDDAQQALNRALSLDGWGLSRPVRTLLQEYEPYPAYLQRAASLLDDQEGIYCRDIRGREKLFRGIVEFFRIETGKPTREARNRVIALWEEAREDLSEESRPLADLYLMRLHIRQVKDCRKDSIVACEQEAYAKASRAFEEAVQADPSWAVPYGYWAEFLSDSRRTEEARLVLEKGLNQAKDNGFLHMVMGHTWYREGAESGDRALSMEKYDLAHQAYEQALSFGQGTHLLYANLGIVLFELGDREGSKQSFLRSIELEPQQYRGYMELARYALLSAEYEATVRWSELCLEKRPGDYDCLNLQALALLELENYDTLKQVIALLRLHHPKKDEADYLTACIAARQGNKPDALHFLGEAMKKRMQLAHCQCEPLCIWIKEDEIFINMIKQWSNEK